MRRSHRNRRLHVLDRRGLAVAVVFVEPPPTTTQRLSRRTLILPVCTPSPLSHTRAALSHTRADLPRHEIDFQGDEIDVQSDEINLQSEEIDVQTEKRDFQGTRSIVRASVVTFRAKKSSFRVTCGPFDPPRAGLSGLERDIRVKESAVTGQNGRVTHAR